MEDKTEYLNVLPPELWAYLAEFLDLRDLGRLAQVCRAFDALFTKNAGQLSKWFRELKVQCGGDDGREARELLDFCQTNIHNTPALLSVLDKLLRRPPRGEAVPAFDNPVHQTVDALTRRVYVDPRNNPRDTLRRALMSIVENSDQLIARAEVIVRRDKVFDERINKLPYVGVAIAILGTILVHSFVHNPMERKSLRKLFAVPALFFAGPLFRESGIVNYYKYRGFWRKVEALPAEELNHYPRLKQEKEGYDLQWYWLKLALKAGTGFVIAAFVFIYLLVHFLTQNRDVVSLPQVPGASGP